MLQKMGWASGKGLGKNEDGMATHIRVKRRGETLGACVGWAWARAGVRVGQRA
jgi:hypothetical protein